MNMIQAGASAVSVGDVEQKIDKLQRSVIALSSVVSDLQERLKLVMSHDAVPPEEKCGGIESQPKCDLSSMINGRAIDIDIQVKILRSVLDRIQL